MSDGADDSVVRKAIRDVLEELLPVLFESDDAQPRTAAQIGAGEDTGRQRVPEPGPITPVPMPPVAVVHRPSSWRDSQQRATPDPRGAPEQRVASAPSASQTQGRITTEQVSIESTSDLEAFARRLLHLYENPRNRQAIVAGEMRFQLHRKAGAESGAGVTRVERGAVTERMVNEAAAAGMRLVLGPDAVLTPMARDRARVKRVEIEKERRC